MKNLSVLSLNLFFFIIALLRKVGEHICSSIYFILIITYLKMISKELLDRTNLAKAQTFYINKIKKLLLLVSTKTLCL